MLRSLIAIAAVGCLASTGRAQTSLCLAPNAVSEEHVRRIGNWTTATDSIGVKTREVFSLPTVSRDEIVEVSSDSICAVAAMRNKQQHPSKIVGDPVPVYVIKVGANRYVVFDQVVMAGEWRVFSVYDSTWQFVGGFLQ